MSCFCTFFMCIVYVLFFIAAFVGAVVAVATVIPVVCYCVFSCYANGCCDRCWDSCRDCCRKNDVYSSPAQELNKGMKRFEPEPKKLLLLGPSGAGKSTIFKQFRHMYGNEFTEDELKDFIPVIHDNIIKPINILLRKAEEEGKEIEDFELKQAMKKLNALEEEGMPLARTAARWIQTVWAHPIIQSIYENRNTFHLDIPDHLEYFVGRLMDIVDASYLPTIEDIIRVRSRTTGIHEQDIEIDGHKFKIMDVGGLRSERKKWIHCFDDVTGVIFVASIADYDKAIFEDKTKNDFEESMELFEELANNRWFRDCAFFLFLNKRDVLPEKLKTHPASAYFPDCNAHEYDGLVQYFQDKLEPLARTDHGQLYTHITAATDPDNMRNVINCLKDCIIRSSLRQAGLIMGGEELSSAPISRSIARPDERNKRLRQAESARPAAGAAMGFSMPGFGMKSAAPMRVQEDRVVERIYEVEKCMDEAKHSMVNNFLEEYDPTIEDSYIPTVFDNYNPSIQMLEDKSADLSDNAWAQPKKKSALFQKSKKKKNKKKKKKKKKIDNIFADMENVFNGLAALLLRYEPWSTDDATLHGRPYQEPIPKFLSTIFWKGPILLLIYCFVSSFTLTIMLPTCFIVLVLRTSKIEKKVETGFAVRQEVLAQETTQEKSVRLISLLLRAIPMLGLLVAWPAIAILIVIPRHGASQTVVNATVGTHLIIIVVLQILGTFRSYKSYLARKEADKEEKLAQFRPDQKTPIHDPHAIVPQFAEEEPSKDHNDVVVAVPDKVTPDTDGTAFPPAYDQIDAGNQARPPEPMFRLKKMGNWIAAVTLLVEALQFATFALQQLNITVEDSQSVTKGYIDENVLPALFITFVNVLSTANIHLVYAYTTFSVCAALILMFLIQFLREVRRFGILKLRKLNQTSANNCFFFSFVGSIVYGHGDLKGVSSWISGFVVVLSDTLFIIVTEKLLLLLTCTYLPDGGSVLTINPEIQCWQGEHQIIAVIALVLFSFYLPLATMIAPMLAEASSISADEAKDPNYDPLQEKKDIRYIQPFLSIITVAKCIMLVAISFFAQASALATVTVSLLTSLVLALITYIWHINSQPRPDLHSPHGKQQPIIDELRQVEPAGLGFVALFRCLAFASGVWGAVVALLASGLAGKGAQEFMSGDVKYIILLIGWVVLGFNGILWYRRWSKNYQKSVDLLWNLSLPEAFEITESTESAPWKGDITDSSTKTGDDTEMWKLSQEGIKGKSIHIVPYVAPMTKTDPERQHLVFDESNRLWSIQEKSVLFVKFREKIKDKRHLLLAVRSFMNITSEREHDGIS